MKALIFTLFISFILPVSGGSPEPDPCNDSQYIALKNTPMSQLSKAQIDCMDSLQEICEDYSKEHDPKETPEL
jgi:hypothetical protein